MLRYRQNSELYHGVSKTKFMFLRLGDFGCSRQQEGRGGYACAARKFGAPLRASTRYLVVDSKCSTYTEKRTPSI